MSAMPDAINWREVLTGEIRAIQGMYPGAHDALRHWGLWSRWRNGLFPRLKPPVIYSLGPAANPDDYTDASDLDRVEIREQTEIKPEGARRESFNERLAVEIDVRIHQDIFPTIWRRCVKSGYVLEGPEYQWPRNAKCGANGFIMFFDAALHRIEHALK